MNWLEELEHINDTFHVSEFTDDLQIVYAKPSTPFFEDGAPIMHHKKSDLIRAKNILVGVLSNFEENLENRSVQYRTDHWEILIDPEQDAQGSSEYHGEYTMIRSSNNHIIIDERPISMYSTAELRARFRIDIKEDFKGNWPTLSLEEQTRILHAYRLSEFPDLQLPTNYSFEDISEIANLERKVQVFQTDGTMYTGRCWAYAGDTENSEPYLNIGPGNILRLHEILYIMVVQYTPEEISRAFSRH